MNPIKQEPVDENFGNFSMANSDWTLNTSGSDQNDTILYENDVKIEIPDEKADANLKEQHRREMAELKAKYQMEVEKLVQKAEMKKEQHQKEIAELKLIKQMQQQMDALAKENASLKKQVVYYDQTKEQIYAYNQQHTKRFEMAPTKKAKDPNAPKKPLTPYFLWMKENRERISTQLGPGTPATVFAKEAGAEWNSMSEKEKATWKQRSKVDKERYAQEVSDYAVGDSDDDDGGTKKKVRK